MKLKSDSGDGKGRFYAVNVNGVIMSEFHWHDLATYAKAKDSAIKYVTKSKCEYCGSQQEGMHNTKCLKP